MVRMPDLNRHRPFDPADFHSSSAFAAGIKISDTEMADPNIVREPFHSAWDYTIRSREK